MFGGALRIDQRRLGFMSQQSRQSCIITIDPVLYKGQFPDRNRQTIFPNYIFHNHILDEIGLQQCASDEECFVSRDGQAILLEHMDDLRALALTDERLKKKLSNASNCMLNLNDETKKDFWGWKSGILIRGSGLSQTRLIEQTVKHFGQVGRKLCS
jgi:hypothetical protein